VAKGIGGGEQPRPVEALKQAQKRIHQGTPSCSIKRTQMWSPNWPRPTSEKGKISVGVGLPSDQCPPLPPTPTRAAMTTAAATMATHHPRARLHVCAAWDMNPGAATVAVPKPSKPKAKPPVSQPPATPTRPPPTHADLFSRSSEGQGTVLTLTKCFVLCLASRFCGLRCLLL
jgi:hypothetical protein